KTETNQLSLVLCFESKLFLNVFNCVKVYFHKSFQGFENLLTFSLICYPFLYSIYSANSGSELIATMANNPQYLGGPGPPLRPMVGSIPPPQNIPPPMPLQFRPVASMHPSQHFTSPSQQYQSLGPGIPPMNLGMPPSQSHQMQFAQSIQQAPPRPIPPGHLPLLSQPLPLPNAPLNRPMSSGLPQPGQDLQVQNNFPPASGGPPVAPPTYAPNAYTTSQYQPVTQMNLQSNTLRGQPLTTSTNLGAATFTPLQQTGQPSPTPSNIKAADSQPKLASSSDWIEHIKNGRRYYYNKKTRKSTWEKPLELMSPIEMADATTDWKEYTSLDGKMYFYNKVTKQSKWKIPDELKLAREHAEKASCVEEVSVDSNVLASASLSDVRTPHNAENFVVNSTPVKVKSEVDPCTSPTSSSPGLANLPNEEPGTQANAVEAQPPSDECAATPGTVDTSVASAEIVLVPTSNALLDQEIEDSSKIVGVQNVEEANQCTSASEKIDISARDDKPVEREAPMYATKQEAKEAFKTLLESANVESDWTWEQTMRLIINDKRYGALKSLGERKQAFNEYLIQKRKQEAEERRARNKKAKEDFRKMLEECSELTSTTRWSKAVIMFGDDERFKAIERARDREDLFQEYLFELEEKESTKAEENHLRYIMEYRKFLESCDFIKEYVGDLEKEEEEQRRIQKEEIRKAERKNRDEFRKLMEGHISDGILTAKTLWREYHSKVKDLPAYQAVSSNSSGSTPKELFEDVAEELNKKYEEVRTRIKDTVKSEKIPVSSTWTLEDFKAAIGNEINDPDVSDDNLKLVFEELLEKVREKEEKEAKRKKRLGDEFFNILCSIKDITGDSQWEDALPFFEACDEFRAIEEEAFSKQIFEEYLGELKEKEKERKRKEEKVMKEKEKEREREREREKRSRDRREKDRKRDRDRGKDRSKRDEEDAEPDLSDASVLNEGQKSGKDRDKKRRKRHQDVDNSSSDRNDDHSRSSHRHSSEKKKSRHIDLPESDDDSKHKKHKREHHNGSRRKADNEELEDGELGNW
ncbi:hypothetical protein KSS87_009057, partial [Heliosperma pusillum]